MNKLATSLVSEVVMGDATDGGGPLEKGVKAWEEKTLYWCLLEVYERGRTPANGLD